MQSNVVHALGIDNSVVDAGMEYSMKDRLCVEILFIIAITSSDVYLNLILNISL
jgi:hypothetical protein